jgi:hypothetical protein
MKLINLIILFIIFIFFFRKNKELFTLHPSKLNIYGEQLAICKSQQDESDRDGSFEDGGYCTELGGGVHQLCFNIKDESKNFAADTKQGYNWSENRLCKKRDSNGKCIKLLKSNNHCMCLGAYSLFKNRQIENSRYKEKTGKTSNELVCNAIPETVFNKEYISSWNSWNTNEIPNQIKVGVEEMVKQCSKNINKDQKLYLINKYCSLAKNKIEMQNSNFYKKNCIERMENNINLELIDNMGDNKIKELQGNSYKEWLKNTQKWCANMRFSPSIITAVIPLRDQNNKNKLYFPISVCCSSDYCEMLNKNEFPKFSYKLNQGIYYLIKDSGQKKKIVQILESFNNENEGKKHINNNQEIYFPYISSKRLKELCSL